MSGQKVPKGYKQTEVGVIPEDWDVGSLSSLTEIRSGIAKNANAAVSNPVLVHYLRVANVQDGFLDLSEMSQLQLNREDIKRYSVLPGDMLMNEGGDLDKLGRGTLWNGEFSPCVHQNHVFVVRCGSKLAPNYLNFWTQTTPSRQYFMLAGRQTTNLASINKTSLGQLPIALPPTIGEQKLIARALSDIDALIEGLEGTIGKKHHIKQGAMRELLRSKDGWEPTALENVSAFITKGTTPTTYGFNWVPQGILFLRSECVSENGLDLSQSMFISSEAHAVLGRSKLTSGDILITITGNVGRVVYLDESFVTANMNQHIARIRITSDCVCSRFIYHFLNQKSVRQAFNTITTGQAYPQISLKQVRDLVVPLPSLQEQQAIATILSDMDTEIATLEAKLTKTRQLKQGMMHELLTGRIRLV
jgi:type I restriction enzyme, S subunit